MITHQPELSHAAASGHAGSVPPLFVVVSGPPGAGKSSLAGPLAAALGLPLLAKDTVKEAFMAVLPVPDVAASRRLGRAAVAVLLAVARDCATGAVLESVWHRSAAAGELAGLPGTVVEVFCRVDADEARRRYARRTGSRAAGHFDARRDLQELSNAETSVPVAGGWPVLTVDTSGPVDVPALAEAVAALRTRQSPTRTLGEPP